jgi:sigma54-dependent transcription regulator
MGDAENIHRAVHDQALPAAKTMDVQTQAIIGDTRTLANYLKEAHDNLVKFVTPQVEASVRFYVETEARCSTAQVAQTLVQRVVESELADSAYSGKATIDNDLAACDTLLSNYRETQLESADNISRIGALIGELSGLMTTEVNRMHGAATTVEKGAGQAAAVVQALENYTPMEG